MGQKNVISVERETELDKESVRYRQCVEPTTVTADFMRSFWRVLLHVLPNRHGLFKRSQLLKMHVGRLSLLDRNDSKCKFLPKNEIMCDN